MCGDIDIAYLSSGVRKRAIVELRCHSVFLGEREKATEAQRLLEESHGRVERALPLGSRKRDLRGKARSDVVTARRLVEEELLATSRAAAFVKFCDRVELPDLEAKTLDDVRLQLAASFGGGGPSKSA